MKRKIRGNKLEPLITFLIGLGLGEAIRRGALWVQGIPWYDLLFIATKIGIIGYVFYLGLKAWAEIVDIEEAGIKYGAKGGKMAPSFRMLPLFFWMMGVAMALIMF